MAALNSTETESLRNVIKLLDYIKRNGFDPKKDKQIAKAINDGKALVHAVVQMKGYYPK